MLDTKKQRTVLITGANRGLGLELVRQYANSTDNTIIACCRKPHEAVHLQALAKEHALITINSLELTDAKSRDHLVQQLQGKALDKVFLNAAVYGKSGEVFGQLEEDNLQQTIHTNSVSQLMLAQSLMPFIMAADEKMLLVVTSKMGSIGDNQKGGSYSYRASKAALNALMRSLALDLYDKGLRVLLLHPGWVRTDMGGPNGLISVEESVSGMIDVIDRRGASSCAEFRSFDDQEIAW